MLTPAELKEIRFEKAVFGGYDMQGVDEFLEPLVKDYEALYNENAVLKGKLKVLVQKLQEIRDAQEAAQQQNDPETVLAEAKAQCKAMLAETREKCDAMLAEAEEKSSQVNMDQLLDQEEARLLFAKKTALNFIQCVEQDIQGHLQLLEKLKTRDLSEELPVKTPVKETPQPQAQEDVTKSIAAEIQESLSGMGIMEDTPEPAPSISQQATSRFPDLQFGSGYSPVGGKK